MAGPEAEFFIFHRDENGEPTLDTHDVGGYFDLDPVDKGDECRQAIELRYIEGVSVAEAAEAMNKPPRMVRGLCYRGLSELRVLMGSSSQFFTKT